MVGGDKPKHLIAGWKVKAHGQGFMAPFFFLKLRGGKKHTGRGSASRQRAESDNRRSDARASSRRARPLNKCSRQRGGEGGVGSVGGGGNINSPASEISKPVSPLLVLLKVYIIVADGV